MIGTKTDNKHCFLPLEAKEKEKVWKYTLENKEEKQDEFRLFKNYLTEFEEIVTSLFFFIRKRRIKSAIDIDFAC